MLNELSRERACVCAPPFTLMKSLPSRPCAPAREPNARTSPTTSTLMRVVVLIDLLVSIVDWLGVMPTFRERGLMVTRTRCNFFDTTDNQFGYNTRQSRDTFGPLVRFGAVE